ncbi:glutathione S-transferase C-terminal domain-containing protein homolog [Spodoptera litura]|uniref:Glutathione S-transferase C-terminal domain-containing protein homolog n=1 Tax=Spodoptera litura TaxID=69820 RepID=A0A9J7E6B0_SPOLT|nr:glutathione S-transferase C-terminal domain-containing protein homolog [Spodoptera litura]
MVGITFRKKTYVTVHLETYTFYKEYQDTHKMKVPLETFIAFCIFKYCPSTSVVLRFVPVKPTPEQVKAAVILAEENLVYMINDYEVPWPVAMCVYPVIMNDDLIVTGLCAVARHIAIFRTCDRIPEEHEEGLLGFRHSCLQAPNEVSIWTKFCEIDMIKAMQEITNAVELKELPKHLVRFEHHLRKPVRVHNIYKVARNIKKESVKTEQRANAGGKSTDGQETSGTRDPQPSTSSGAPASNSGSLQSVEEEESVEKLDKVEQQPSAEVTESVVDEEQKCILKSVDADQLTVMSKADVTIEEGDANDQQQTAEQKPSTEQPANAEQQASSNQTETDNQVPTEKSSNAEIQALADKQTPNESGEGTSAAQRIAKPRKWRSLRKRECLIESTTKIEDLQVNHEYAEGPFLTLADLVLLPTYHVIIQTIGEQRFESLLPTTYRWYKKVMSLQKVQDTFVCYMDKFDIQQTTSENISLPTSEDVSLYKTDPKRHNPRKRIYTREEDIEAALSFIKEGMELPISENNYEPAFEWKDIPEYASPYAGFLPDTRAQRKSQQLENLVLAVLKMATDGDVIVDFCSGGGHLGILLAYLLPRCTIIFLENKVQSLFTARERIQKLRINNVFYFQCNLDFFIGEFDIGVGLHACGIATDLILDKCVQAKAKFVVSPCCYGSLHYTNRLIYPRSQAFTSVPILNYLCLAHAADQTHKEHPLAVRGARCMAIIDSDRARLAEEMGYKVTLMKLKPPTCTPKNDLLIGIPPEE